MKKVLFVITIFILSQNNNYLKAQDCVPQPGFDECDESSGGGGGTGTPVPIDDYLPILVVLGITLGGAVVYKNRKRLS